MAERSLVDPNLFSTHFGLVPEVLAKEDIFDPILNSDTLLFIDPLLIRKSANDIIRSKGNDEFEKSLETVIRLVKISKREGDPAWKGAYKALYLSERPETGLGYGRASTRGSSRPQEVRLAILRTVAEVLELGVDDLDMLPLMAVFEDGVGADTLSDLATNAMLNSLCEITDKFCQTYGVPVRKFGGKYGHYSLPENPFVSDEPVILVPRDILRDLPIAADWSDVSGVIAANDELRERVNKMFGSLAEATMAERKMAVRKAAFSSDRLLKQFLDAVAEAADSYDEKVDLDGFYIFRQLLASDPDRYKGLISKPSKQGEQELKDMVFSILAVFKDMIENNNLWRLLWYNDRPRREKASQLTFFAIAKILCAANDIDISPETDSGGGPVDFKFSKGFAQKVVVEFKLSRGKVKQGYERQIEKYKKAAGTDDAIFVVIDVGSLKDKLDKVNAIKAAREAKGLPTSEVILIDAKRQKSASNL